VRTREEAERLLAMPVLGEIPKPKTRGRPAWRRGAAA